MAIAEEPTAGPTDLPSLCLALQQHQKQRVWYLKSRNMLQNRLFATVSGSLGYHSGMGQAEREKKWEEAKKHVKQLIEQDEDSELTGMICASMLSIDSFERAKKRHEDDMLMLAKQLPVADWTLQPDQRGFALLSLATVIGETGDLDNYDCPSKVWRRMACAPYTKGDETLMGKTWRQRIGNKKGLQKLSAADWEDYGYSPRRRSISWQIGKNLMMLNKGPYRRRFEEAKQKAFESHPDWLQCFKCEGTGKLQTGAKCPNCKGTGQVTMRCHNHAMLLGYKLLLLNLWMEWTGTIWTEWKERS